MADAEIEKKGCCQKFGDGLTGFFAFLYNKEAGLVMGRNGESWAKIGFFYLIFYGFLAGFFSGMLAIFLTTLESPGEGGPKLIQYLENQPGLNRLDNQNKLRLDYYKKPEKETLIKNYVNFVDEFIGRYQKGWKNSNTNCSASSEEGIPVGNKPCIFDRTLLKNCSGLVDQSYGLNITMPCFFVKINKIFGWVPKSNNGNGYLKLRCNEKDGVQIFPPEGFLINAFPFRGQKPFELPVVAVQIDVTKHSSVSCSLEGKGIEVSPSYVPSRAYGNIRIRNDKL